MVKKRKIPKKASKRVAKKPAKKVAAKKAARAKTAAAKSPVKAVPKKSKSRRGSRVVEPSSGSASSSLDPKRAGRLQLNNVDENSRRRRIGDLQGISMKDQADSESVGELLEEGQTLEAEAVSGVENALDADQGEIRTHEVPEDDVPGEYLDQDSLDQQ